VKLIPPGLPPTIADERLLRHILVNRLYLGEIVHKGRSHPGNHAAILTPELFEAVRAKLASAATLRKDRPIRARSGPLTGKLFDAAGRPMTPSFGYGRGGQVYRYYVSMPASPEAGARPPKIQRLSAATAEQIIADLLRRTLRRDELLIDDIATLVSRVEAREG